MDLFAELELLYGGKEQSICSGALPNFKVPKKPESKSKHVKRNKKPRVYIPISVKESCLNGDVKRVEEDIKHGGLDWKEALYASCYFGHYYCAKFILETATTQEVEESADVVAKSRRTAVMIFIETLKKRPDAILHNFERCGFDNLKQFKIQFIQLFIDHGFYQFDEGLNAAFVHFDSTLIDFFIEKMQTINGRLCESFSYCLGWSIRRNKTRRIDFLIQNIQKCRLNLYLYGRGDPSANLSSTQCFYKNYTPSASIRSLLWPRRDISSAFLQVMILTISIKHCLMHATVTIGSL